MTAPDKAPLWYRLIPPSALALLAPGEQPVFTGTVGSVGGDDRIGLDPKGKRITGFTWDPFLSLATGFESDDGWMDRVVGGVAATGGINSVAAHWMAALQASKLFPRLLVTDRRVLLLDEGKSSMRPDPATGRNVIDNEITVLLAMPRTIITAVSHQPRPFAFGRAQVRFGDGSQVALMMGILSWRKVSQLRRALGC